MWAPAGGGGAGDASRWQVFRAASRVGTAREAPGPAVWLVEVESTAVVIGSTQAHDVVDPDFGVPVVRRNTGGGAVLVVPGDLVWIDVFVPAGDPHWSADVGRAFWWLGDVWVDALATAGVEGAVWHDGPARRSPLSDLACFAGLGPGEVTVDGRKVVGLCQRRTRAGAFFQCAALLAWDATRLGGLLRLGEDDVAVLARSAAALPVPAAELEQRFLAALAGR